MKNKITSREKVLLVVLVILIIGSMWYMLFFTPTQEKKAQYEAELLELDDTVLMAEARVLHMRNMKTELEAILADTEREIKETPLYDNKRPLMESLNMILMNAKEYNISFSALTEEEKIVRREVALSYQCGTYDQVKEILQNIHDGKYPCIIKDVSVSYNQFYSISATLTFFEYAE